MSANAIIRIARPGESRRGAKNRDGFVDRARIATITSRRDECSPKVDLNSVTGRPGRFEPAFSMTQQLALLRHRSKRPRFDASIAPSERRSEEHTSELQSPCNLVCRLLLEKKKTICTQPLFCTYSLHSYGRS